MCATKANRLTLEGNVENQISRFLGGIERSREDQSLLKLFWPLSLI